MENEILFQSLTEVLVRLNSLETLLLKKGVITKQEYEESITETSTKMVEEIKKAKNSTTIVDV